MGRTEVARGWFEQVADLDRRHEMLAWYHFASGRKAELKEHLAEDVAYSEPFTAVLLAMVGQTERAAELIESAAQTRLSPAHASLARGAIAFFEGRVEEAIQVLEDTLSRMDESGDPVFFAGSDILAMARHSRGQLDGAIEALEMTARQRDRSVFSNAGLHWVKCQSRLATYYREADREGERRSTDGQLRLRLRFAQDDFPVLGEIDGRQS